ncbi:hypothetical protein BJ742DRAFT_773950 [Cladochytrium replicatum]|nr:hypothetical protein BJ742DRAFT_773950 [Cladochytrium replicatum]
MIMKLLKQCHEGWDAVVTLDVQHQFGGALDEAIVLGECFPIEITVSKAGRSVWHCSDYVMIPNVDQLPIYQTDLVPLTHAFLAKTKHPGSVISSDLSKTNLSVPVRYMSHSSANGLVGVEHIKRDFNKFFPGFGHSGLKSTRDVYKPLMFKCSRA